MTNPSGERHYRGEVQERKVDVGAGDVLFSGLALTEEISADGQ